MQLRGKITRISRLWLLPFYFVFSDLLYYFGNPFIRRDMLKYAIPVLFLSFFLNAQEKNDDIVARIGSTEISKTEFQERYLLNPQMGIHRKGQAEANKRNFLYGVIAEKLLSLEAQKIGLDTSSTSKYFLKNFEKMFVRDELYNRVVTKKSVEFSENLLSFYLNNASRIFTKTIISKDKDQITKTFTMLNRGVPFDTVYSELTPQERDTITLYSGTLDDRTEKELFSLPEKHFSKPMQYNDHWVIFYIENKSNPVMAKSMGWESEYKRLEKVAKEKAEAVYYKQFMENFFSGRKADAKGYFIKSLSERVTALVNENASDTGSYYLSSADVVHITRSYSADTLNSSFIIFETDSIPFHEFLLWLRTEVFELKEKNYDRIAAHVNAKVKKFIEYELLAREGYRQGLDKSENVKKMLSMWRDNYLFQLQVSLISDSLLRHNKGFDFVKLAEFISNDLELIEKVLNEVSQGKELVNLISKYSSDSPDTSFRTVSSLGDLSEEVMQADIGDIVGPVKSNEGYVIFKVLDKKTSEDEAGIRIDNKGKDAVRNPFDNYIAALAKKYGVSINEAVLPEVSNSNINAVIFKYLGFGGRVAAVPIINPISGWYQEWKKEVQPNP